MHGMELKGIPVHEIVRQMHENTHAVHETGARVQRARPSSSQYALVRADSGGARRLLVGGIQHGH